MSKSSVLRPILGSKAMDLLILPSGMRRMSRSDGCWVAGNYGNQNEETRILRLRCGVRLRQTVAALAAAPFAYGQPTGLSA